MWQQQGTGDSLASIIQQLQLRRETGRLIARHGREATSEEGIIVFVNGRVTEARIGRRTGSEVFNRLSRWENCSCQFVRSGDNSARPITGTLSGEMLETPDNILPELSTPVDLSQRRTAPLEKIVWTAQSGHLPSPEVPSPVDQHYIGLQKIEQLGLSRAHRRLFLLIDGRRSAPDLARLMGRGKDEIDQLLQDLEQLAIIRIPR
jgi:hypothetical protein